MDTGMDEAQALFVADCTTQLDGLELQLLALECKPADRSGLDAVFRAVHTIKGNAAVVQQSEVEWFAHITESVLVRLRDGVLYADAELVSVLLACCDHLRFLVRLSCLETPVSPDFAEADRARLIGLLVPYLDGEDLSARTADKPAAADGTVMDPDACWRLNVQFAPEVLRQGMDPAYFMRHLASLGRICSLQVDTEGIPDLSEYDPELCYLRFQVLLDTRSDKQTIEDIFIFVRESCTLQILPPVARLDGYVGRIHALPNDDLHTGEMLMRVGVLTPSELASGLRVQRAEGGAGKPLGSILVDEGFVPPEVVSAVLQRQNEIRQELAREGHAFRVSTEQLEALLTNIGVLQCTVAEMASCGRDLVTTELDVLSQGLEKARRLVEGLRSTRFGEQFRRLHRVVRDAAQDLGKKVDLRLSGSDIVLERPVADLLSDALMHLLRNAIDHGLESPAQRREAGKLAHGMLSVDAREEEDWLVFTVADDGAGIDCDKVCAVAIARGLLPAGARPDAEALYALLFEPGFTTAEMPTHYSGRGVGLDVVRDAVLALGGEINVHSTRGAGSRFEIRLPTVGEEPEPRSTDSVTPVFETN
ncbi:MAG: chemotaxis protein CheA [Proteobacteria bacterium]|nr:chemotaxis protein CheA [Pseudomonadota bacterium]